ncbi:MAG: hypothetical protein ACOCU6_00670 [Nanoarchaeota archaeon]
MLYGQRGGQTWSFDLIIAVVLFIVVVGIFYAYLSDSSTEDDEVKHLSGEARLISTKLDCDVDDNDVCITRNGMIVNENVDELKSEDYDNLKKQLGVKGDFCIYLRDSEGNLKALNGTAGIGDKSFKLNENTNCSQLIS